MNNIKKKFSIRDLENLSGIKAHTIRIWEKRYNLLTPERTDTNIRTYSLNSLQKLLNITLLYNNGFKISKIANIAEHNIPIKVREIVIKKNVKNHTLNSFKLAMINFDQSLFLRTYNALLTEQSFREIFKDVFIPLLNELGMLWQTDTISPIHEHFIAGLIKQKILINTEKIQHLESSKNDKTFVLFLPDNEIHDIGLLYLNYELTLRGYRTIYLGQTVPLENLTEILGQFNKICFISYFTVSPEKNQIHKYLNDYANLVEPYNNPELWILGHQMRHLQENSLPEFIKVYPSIDKALENVELSTVDGK